MSSVEFRNVAKSYAGVQAVRDVSFRISSGELVTLLGPSGCGKTTTLNLVAGFMQPDEGSILIDGRSVEKLPAHKRNTTMVFQGYALFPHLTVARNVAFGLEMRKVPRDDVARRVDEALRLVQLGGMSERYPRQLSGGQQQRVALARALAVRPDVLLLDEPLSNLDAKLREEMREEIRAVQRTVGITAIYVTHDQEEALAVSDRVVVMNAGAIEQIGTPHEIYRRPRSLFVAQFIGLANLLPVDIEGSEGERLRVVTEEGLRLTVRRRDGDPSRGRATLMVRPEDITLTTGAAASAENALAGEVEQQVFLGAINTLQLRVGQRTLRAHATSAAMQDIDIGSRVSIGWNADQCLLVEAR
jgi:putative spermidine/putrescine transport system ATP-binding protein